MNNFYKRSNQLVLQFALLACSGAAFAQSTKLSAKDANATTLATCPTLPSTHISNFTSVLPSTQPDSLRIPSTHTFQMLLQTGDAYTNASDGVVKAVFDFTGYVPIAGSSTNGYLSINHEGSSVTTAGVSMLSLNYNAVNKLWQVTDKSAVNFSPVQGTTRNCSGTVTPWNTIITSEEILPNGDANNDGYTDIGWNVQINPATHSVMDNDGDGTQDKLWRLGRMSHENVVVAADRKTVYEGNDENPGYIFKFVADVAEKLNAGKLYVLKLTGTTENSSAGSWIEVPVSTPTECNNVRTYAGSVGATNFNSIEDVEFGTVDSLIYFTSKVSSRVYRFRDLGVNAGVDSFSIYVGNSATNYTINYNGGSASEQWRTGNDNLTFDDKGNLYVLQDGDRNHIWMVRACHTQADPKVELFAVTPAGCEPTGMTFSPDYKFMFVSIQEPGNNAKVMKDAAGNQVQFNKSSAIVIARKEDLGLTTLPISLSSFDAQKTSDNQVSLKWTYTTNEEIVKFEVQRMTFGNGFQTIETVVKHAANQANNFAYTDRSPYTGDNFYRIRTVDADGKESLSLVKQVSIPQLSAKQTINAYPNPSNGALTISVTAAEAGKANLRIVDNAGRVVKQEKTELVKGSNSLSLDVQSFVPGAYHIIIATETQSYSTTFIKN